MRIGHKERKIVAVLAALGVLALLLAGFIFIPKADIKLVLRTAPLLIDQKLTLAAEGTSGENIIPSAAFFREITIEGTAPVAGKEVVGAKAKGTVEIINRSTDEQKIKEKSRLVTADGVLFYMEGHAIVPPASGGVPARARVAVEAAEAGESGNIKPQQLNFAALDAASQKLVYAQATAALAGGSGDEVAVVTEEDLDNAKKLAGQAVRDKAEQEIREELPKDMVLLEESWTAEIQSFETEAAIGAQQETIPYKTQVIVRVLAYNGHALEEKLRAALTSRLEKEYVLFPGPISYTKSVDNINWETGTGELTTRVTHTTIPNLKLETLREKLAGRSLDEANTYLQGLPGVSSVDLKLWPFWAKSLPYIQQRITIDLVPERQP